MKTIYIFILALLLQINVISQTNLIPNYSFEIANSGAYPSCSYGNTNYGANHFDSDIDSWKVARHSNDYVPDWIDLNICSLYDMYGTFCAPMPNYYSSNRFIILRTVYDYSSFWGTCSKEHAAIRVAFYSAPLNISTTYLLRFKYIPISTQDIHCPQFEAVMTVYLTTWGPNWDANNSNNQILNVDQFNTSFSPGSCYWRFYEHEINLPATGFDNLNNLILYCDENAFLIDDVELIEKCPNVNIIQNKVYSWQVFDYNMGDLSILESSDNILKAGCCEDPNQSYGPVIIENTSNVSFTAGAQISLMSGFHAEFGSEFDARIVPCNGNRSLSINDPNYNNDVNMQDSNFTIKPLEKYESDVLRKENLDEALITVSPNPANNTLFINGLTYPALTTVYDLSGKIMLSTQLNNNQLDIRQFANGVYFIKLITAENNIVRKFMKE